MQAASNKPQNPQETEADFGFTRVKQGQKQKLVRGVFDDVASNYDLMNDAMSFGMHRLWKDRFTSRLPYLDEDSTLLDVAGGTGDIAHRLHKKTGARVIILDINEAMLRAGIDTRFDTGNDGPFDVICGNAQALPLPDNSCDLYTIAFGLRNVTLIDSALAEAYRVLKPGGQFRCLEFSPIDTPVIKQLYDVYSFQLLPRMGKALAGTDDAYQYLAESIRMFSKASELTKRIYQAGFDKASHTHLSLGVVAIHTGWKF
jgi:demethylmenaquinone methyltransferase/2-methoxy-6-polyprenyl-1,4-benzoquinol methylase